jgi:hypothetical protein
MVKKLQPLRDRHCINGAAQCGAIGAIPPNSEQAQMDTITLQYIENSLYNGELWAHMRNGHYWRLRRNGQTQKWKTRPADFRIPVKAGFKSYGEVTHRSAVALLSDSNWRTADFVIGSDPNNQLKD